MRPNRGKEFEAKVKKAFEKIPDISIDRLPDQMSGRKGSSNVSDFIVYAYPHQYYIECKAFYGNTINFSKIPQLDALYEKSKIKGVRAGCMLWFIDHDITVWVNAPILKICKLNGRKSINIKDIKDNSVSYTVIEGSKKRVFFEYNMIPFIERS